jgi:hypothetical protein
VVLLELWPGRSGIGDHYADGVGLMRDQPHIYPTKTTRDYTILQTSVVALMFGLVSWLVFEFVVGLWGEELSGLVSSMSVGLVVGG